MKVVELNEDITSDFDVGRIDERYRLLRDVAVLGEVSRNGRRYSEQARRDAVRVFEGAKVFLNHRDSRFHPRPPHQVENYVGRLEGLRLDDDGVVRAKKLRVVNESHWSLLSSIARGDPAGMGLSIDGEGEMKDGVVTSVKTGRSVDIVSEPAAVNSLFEETTEMPPEERDTDNKMKEFMDKLTIDDIKKYRPDIIDMLKAEIIEELKKQAAAAAEAPGGGGKNEKKVEKAVQQSEGLTIEQKLDRIVRSGAALSEVELKAVKRLDTIEEIDEFLKMKSTRNPKSSMKASAAEELSTASLREVMMS